MTDALEKARAKYVGSIDEAELAVRMCEASYGLTRPKGYSATQALEAMDEDCREGWKRAARTAMRYWSECISNANTTN
jgi:hypothetical protein